MSDNKYNRFCRKCGEYTGGTSLFCYACGSRLSEAAVGTADVSVAPESVPKSSREQAPQPAREPQAAYLSEAQRPEWYKFIRTPVVRSALTAVLALALMLLLFCPFVGVKAVTSAGGGYKTSFTPFELAKLGFYSFASYEDRELSDTAAYAEYRSLSSRAASYMESSKIGAAKERVLSDYNKAALTVELMRVGNGATGSLIFSLIASVAYAGVLITIFLLSAISLVKRLLLADDDEQQGAGAAKLATYTAAAYPVYLLLLLHACQVIPLGNGASVAWAAVVSVIACLGVAAYVGLMCYERMTGFGRVKLSYSAKMRLCTISAALLTAVAIFLPALSVQYAAPKGKSVEYKTLYVDSTDVHEMSDSEQEAYGHTWYSAAMVIKNAATEITADKDGYSDFGTQSLNMLLIGSSSGFSTLYTFIAITAFITLAMSMLCIYKMMHSIITSKRAVNQRTAFFLTILPATVYFALCVALAIIANGMLGSSLARYILFGVGIGPVMVLLSTITSAVLLKIQIRGRVARGFDNPDVSYAPYVV